MKSRYIAKLTLCDTELYSVEEFDLVKSTITQILELDPRSINQVMSSMNTSFFPLAAGSLTLLHQREQTGALGEFESGIYFDRLDVVYKVPTSSSFLPMSILNSGGRSTRKNTSYRYTKSSPTTHPQRWKALPPSGEEDGIDRKRRRRNRLHLRQRHHNRKIKVTKLSMSESNLLN